MNLRKISDPELLANTEKLARQEREILTRVLHHLREIERRRLFSALGYKSLFEYAVKRLGYSDDQAGRRIAAMRLLQEIPEIESKIESGALTLTNIGMAQSLFRSTFRSEYAVNYGKKPKGGAKTAAPFAPYRSITGARSPKAGAMISTIFACCADHAISAWRLSNN